MEESRGKPPRLSVYYDIARAREYFEKRAATGVTNFVEYQAAQAELRRMKK